MARSQDSWNKREKEKKRKKKNEEKAQKKEAARNSPKESSLESMMAWVDEYGRIMDTPPDENHKKEEIDPEDIEIGIPKREEEEIPMRKGKVTFFNTDKGYGFIRDSISGESIFVHINSLDGPLQENEIVTFETEKGTKGPVAVNVQKA